jgi:hypothetical protein
MLNRLPRSSLQLSCGLLYSQTLSHTLSFSLSLSLPLARSLSLFHLPPLYTCFPLSMNLWSRAAVMFSTLFSMRRCSTCYRESDKMRACGYCTSSKLNPIPWSFHFWNPSRTTSCKRKCLMCTYQLHYKHLLLWHTVGEPLTLSLRFLLVREQLSIIVPTSHHQTLEAVRNKQTMCAFLQNLARSRFHYYAYLRRKLSCARVAIQDGAPRVGGMPRKP